MKCKTSPKRDGKVEEETKLSSFHVNSSHKKHKPKDNKKRYNRPANSNAFHNGKQHADLNNMFSNVFPCTFFLSSNHCVDKCDKRKATTKKMFMSNGIETKKRKSHPRFKTREPREAQKNFCTHYNISGNWVEKCWKLFPQLHVGKCKQVLQAPKEEATKEKVVQDATIPKAASEEEKVQIEGSFA